MNKQEYLYGKDVSVPKIPEEVANERLRLLDKNLHDLLDVGYLKRDNLRVNAVMKAMKFWKGLRDGI